MVNLFIFEDSDVSEDGFVYIRDPEKVGHLKKVLKVEIGSTIKMGKLKGSLYTGHIVEIDKQFYKVRLEEVEGTEFKYEGSGVCLILGTPRPKMIKSIGTVSATMGVDQILYVKSERVDKSYFQSKMLGEEQVKKDLIHGAEQGVIRQIPNIATYPNQTLQHFVENTWKEWEQKLGNDRAVVKLIAEPRVPQNLISATFEALKDQKRKDHPMFVLAIGPEGGWIPSEVEMFKEAGFLPFHMGDRILRTETAVVALLSQIMLLNQAMEEKQLNEFELTSLKRKKGEEDNNNNNIDP